MSDIIIPKPSESEVEKYLDLWDKTERYTLHENALNKLFGETYSHNNDINEILIKVSALNDFYTTNIYDTLPVAKHILSLNIDLDLSAGKYSLIDEIARVKVRNGTYMYFYSFASKYCSHHYPEIYPIYDSYVDKVLRHFRKQDKFCDFKNIDLKSYERYIYVLKCFSEYYSISKFTLKQIDQYLWQLGKQYLPNKY